MIAIKKDDYDASQLKKGYKYDDKLQLWYDEIEDTATFRAIIEDVLKEVNDIMIKEGIIQIKDGEQVYPIGSSYKKWDIQKRLLKDKYNIKWRTPHEVNPFILFD